MMLLLILMCCNVIGRDSDSGLPPDTESDCEKLNNDIADVVLHADLKYRMECWYLIENLLVLSGDVFGAISMRCQTNPSRQMQNLTVKG